jgi:hypothetical protein
VADVVSTDGATVAATLLIGGQPGKAASVRVNHTGSPRQDSEHENLHTLVT